MIEGKNKSILQAKGRDYDQDLNPRLKLRTCPSDTNAMNRKFLFIMMIISCNTLWATEVRENYNGIRSLGMGGAGVAIVNDETAMHTNPAGLGRLRDSYGTIIDPEIETSYTSKKMYDAKAFTNPLDLEQAEATADASRGSLLHTRAQIFPSYVAKNFGIGFHGLRTLDAKMNAAGTAMTTYYRDDLSLLLGVNLRLFDGRIKIGAVGKAISRIEIDKDIPIPGSLDVSQHASEGVGVGIDSGIIMTAPIAWLPTIAAVMRDAGSTPFDSGSGLRLTTTTRPKTIEQDIDVGLSVFPIHSNSSRSTFTLEYQKLTEASKAVDKNRYYHLGYEFNYGDLFFLRMGMNQRYWTAGIEFASEHTQFQIASYGEDIGVDGSPEEDRRYVFKFSFRF